MNKVIRVTLRADDSDRGVLSIDTIDVTCITPCEKAGLLALTTRYGSTFYVPDTSITLARTHPRRRFDVLAVRASSPVFLKRHTLRCQDQIRCFEQRLAEWIMCWPLYCHECNGYGRYEVTSCPTRYEVDLCCDFCTSLGICPRCRYLGLSVDGEGPCHHCGWNYDDGLPFDSTCQCHET